ncbi:type III-B CRISPR module RAMP protein Cmr6 [Orenia metallireducens]|uniref:Type III-B CRISPR module RAMP protein Cmr6 n=1 Tax=Orenia metallireducens TaxID=1413210 RepID=A0A1C0A8A1_9FIRM|nr:type III-B CRISPR module RAMP protein Cmr6 [Orenia metallireducens]OCL26489.1 type III-B CRISPR module RAMP protein Cmr6 [Orenia metallireducens]
MKSDYELKKATKNDEKRSKQIREGKYIFVQKDEKGRCEIIENHLYKELRDIAPKQQDKVINKLLRINKFCNINYLPKKLEVREIEKEIMKKQEEEMEVIKKEWTKTHDFLELEFKVLDKLVIGLGTTSVFETSILLHHIYGIPYIPGQAIKGVIRNYILLKEFSENQDEKEVDNKDEKSDDEKKKTLEEKAFENDNFRYIFGASKKKDDNQKNPDKNQGNLIFFDAFPKDKYKIEKDVVTPHYGDYYGEENEAPTDDMQPNPINFLVVKDATFKVYIGIKKNTNKEIRTYIEKYFIEAFEYVGIGAKTSLGYGFMQVENLKKSIQNINRGES